MIYKGYCFFPFHPSIDFINPYNFLLMFKNQTIMPPFRSKKKKGSCSLLYQSLYINHVLWIRTRKRTQRKEKRGRTRSHEQCRKLKTNTWITSPAPSVLLKEMPKFYGGGNEGTLGRGCGRGHWRLHWTRMLNEEWVSRQRLSGRWLAVAVSGHTFLPLIFCF